MPFRPVPDLFYTPFRLFRTFFRHHFRPVPDLFYMPFGLFWTFFRCHFRLFRTFFRRHFGLSRPFLDAIWTVSTSILWISVLDSWMLDRYRL
ncbi:hypothetical protein RhiirA4_551047 [Rhizophagus irregularis]|uniref:Uncharacterized protein n=1 Tax=Rhizophagus irregularis TaxID=588596 RepID=A0A2I1HSP1_9GLOM|nr:hypothetical protein RhiirA4_551047 [Rhizophagus irregularis]